MEESPKRKEAVLLKVGLFVIPKLNFRRIQGGHVDRHY
jgi:hypothetical protein